MFKSKHIWNELNQHNIVFPRRKNRNHLINKNHSIVKITSKYACLDKIGTYNKSSENFTGKKINIFMLTARTNSNIFVYLY